jgi:hypothetical protein
MGDNGTKSPLSGIKQFKELKYCSTKISIHSLEFRIGKARHGGFSIFQLITSSERSIEKGCLGTAKRPSSHSHLGVGNSVQDSKMLFQLVIIDMRFEGNPMEDGKKT